MVRGIQTVWETVCTRALKEESEAVWEVTVSAGHLVLESDHHLPKPKNTTFPEQGRCFYVCSFFYSVSLRLSTF